MVCARSSQADTTQTCSRSGNPPLCLGRVYDGEFYACGGTALYRDPHARREDGSVRAGCSSARVARTASWSFWTWPKTRKPGERSGR